MTVLKSNAVSLALHASALGALCCIPSAVLQRFNSPGPQSVVSIEMEIGSEPSVMTSIVPQFETISGQQDRDAFLIDERLVERDVDPMRRQQSELRHLAANRSIVVPPNMDEVEPVKIKRRETPLSKPVVEIDPPERERLMAVDQLTPQQSTSPVDALVGLQEEAKIKFTYSPPPEYPAEAVRKRFEGVVMLRLVISKLGSVQQVQVSKSSGHDVLDRAAIKAVATWKGEPAKRWGHAIESTEVLPIRFRL